MSREDLVQHSILADDTVEPRDDVSAEHALPKTVMARRSRRLRAAASFGFALTLLIPIAAMAVLSLNAPIITDAPKPVSVELFSLVFVYTVTFLLAIGVLTSRPLTPREHSRSYHAGVFAFGICSVAVASCAVVLLSPLVHQTLAGKALVAVQGIVCAAAFTACAVSSIRLSQKASGHLRRRLPTCTKGSGLRRAFARDICKTANGFDQGTVRSQAGVTLVALATGFAGVSLFETDLAYPFALHGAGVMLLVFSTLLCVLYAGSRMWLRIALPQWTALLVGGTIGYFALNGTTNDAPFELGATFVCLIAFLAGIMLMVSHDAEPARFEPLPLPDRPRTIEDVCLDAADELGLTRREEETLLLLLFGYQPQQISDELGVSRKTVTAHTQNVCRKAGVANRSELIESLLKELTDDAS